MQQNESVFSGSLCVIIGRTKKSAIQYIGEMAKDYIYAVVPLLTDALQERDPVHRQIAIDAVAHLALGVYGFGCEVRP